ncbi:MAG: DNA-3-methyladenine glycosylase I [Eubacteriales bacterium]
MNRCGWANHELSIKYHDEEWGKIATDDTVLYEFLILEGAQAGLNWLTILKKREGYRKAFDNFDYKKVAEYDEAKMEELRNNPEIIRNRLKIHSAVTNARHFIEVQNEFGSFYKYLWSFVDGKQVVNSWERMDEMPVSTELSDRISKDLKKRGFKFVGTTIVYSYLQAIGVINDHLLSCSFR